MLLKNFIKNGLQDDIALYLRFFAEFHYPSHASPISTEQRLIVHLELYVFSPQYYVVCVRSSVSILHFDDSIRRNSSAHVGLSTPSQFFTGLKRFVDKIIRL